MNNLRNLAYSFLGLFISLMILTACAVPATPAHSTEPSSEPLTPIAAMQNTVEPESVLALGYYTGSQESYQSFIDFSSFLDIVSVDVYGLDGDGTIVGVDQYDIVSQEQAENIDFYACISNWNSDPEVNNFDPELARVAIVTQKEKMISQLVALAVSKGYAGINIDLESIAYSSDLSESRAAFNLFIHELAVKLHENGKKLIISVAAKVNDDPTNDWSYPFDLASLGEDADYLQLMTYDQHGSWGEPGPVSCADWLEEVIDYTSSVVDPAKLLIGLPAYGYNWDLSAPNENESTFVTTDFNWIDVPALHEKPGAQSFWDETSQSPYITYTEEDHSHVAWFENQASLIAKVSLISKYKLAGLSVWALGKEDLAFWEAVSNSNN